MQRLKNELEKCLINNLSKRNRLDKLTKELNDINSTVETLKSTIDQVEAEKRDLELKNALLCQQSAGVNSNKYDSVVNVDQQYIKDIEHQLTVSIWHLHLFDFLVT